MIKDWQIGGFASYESGPFILIPTTGTSEFLTTQDIYVKGQPLYTPGVDINNLSTYNPYTTQVLNPAAWAQCPVATNCGTGTALGGTAGNYMKNFRGPRTPRENANIGRNFRFKERWNLQIRGEFTNIFNRTLHAAADRDESADGSGEERIGNPNRRLRSHQRLPGAKHGRHIRRHNGGVGIGGARGNDHRPVLVLDHFRGYCRPLPVVEAVV